jgi:hypothetical protein
MAAAVATGEAIFSRPKSDPVDVLVVDYENDIEDDVIPRLDAFGYRAEQLDRLHWYSFPRTGGLDTQLGAARLERLLDKHQPELVVLDSFSRAVVGPENDADTVRAYYWHTGLVLKRHQVCSVRLDNSGHDESRARGSSAKGDDVDVVWRLKRREGGLQLRREAQRSPLLPEVINLRRIDDDPMRYALVEETVPAGTSTAIELLDRLAVPLGSSVRKAREALRAAKETCSNEALTAALRARRNTEWNTSEATDGANP